MECWEGAICRPQRSTFPIVPSSSPSLPLASLLIKHYSPLSGLAFSLSSCSTATATTRASHPLLSHGLYDAPLAFLTIRSLLLFPNLIYFSQIGPDLQKLSPIYCSTLCFQGLCGSSVIICIWFFSHLSQQSSSLLISLLQFKKLDERDWLETVFDWLAKVPCGSE